MIDPELHHQKEIQKAEMAERLQKKAAIKVTNVLVYKDKVTVDQKDEQK